MAPGLGRIEQLCDQHMATSGVGYLGFQSEKEMQAESLLPLLRTIREGAD